jgi:hypothetical protein
MEALQRVLPFFLLIVAGALAARARTIDAGGATALTRYVLWIAFPALLLRAFYDAPAPEAGWVRGLGGYAAAALLPFPLAFLAARAFAWSDRTRAGVAMTGTVGNSAFLGLPLAASLYGPAVYAMGISVVAVDAVLLGSVGVALARNAAGAGSWRRSFLGVLGNPILLAAAAGLALGALHLRLPEPIDAAAALLAPTASPVALVALGAIIALGPDPNAAAERQRAPIAIALAFKLLLVPLAVWLALGWVDAPPIFRAVATLMSASPTAVTAFVQLQNLDVFGRGAAQVVTIGTALSAATLTILALTLA